MPISHLKPEIACERLIKQLRKKGITSERVLETFKEVPRHLFVDGGMFAKAYDDDALPIGNGQTISQPFVVALMTQALDLGKDEKILEIGTGSGFQAAILARFSRRVYTIERHNDLGSTARKRLRGMGYENIVFKVGDGSIGWPQHAPFDRSIVPAGAPASSDVLLKQLGNGGKMVIPVGDRGSQSLQLFEKTENGVRQSTFATVSFVPLIGRQGWRK